MKNLKCQKKVSKNPNLVIQKVGKGNSVVIVEKGVYLS